MAQAHFEPTWAFIKRPTGYPTGPAVGKPELILQSRGNDKSLYHRLSPYSNYHQGLISWGDEPYYYIYPDQAHNFPQSLKKYDSHIFAPGSGIIDVIRTSKFLVSGRGVTFLATQFLLQTASPYNERRIYNPTSPIVAAGLTLTLGSARPDRAFDTSAGLAGIASTLLGGLGSTIFGAPKTNPVAGTTLVNNAEALPEATKTTGTKGLLRAGDANRGLANLQVAWPGTGGKQGSSSGFLSAVKNLVGSLFANFIPQTQAGMQFRSDEGAYGMMVASDFKFSYLGQSKDFGFGQTWIAGKSGTVNIRKKSEYTTSPYKIFIQYRNGYAESVPVSTQGGLSTTSIPTVGSVGTDVSESTVERKPGYRYGDAVGAANSDDFDASEVMYQYKYFVDQKFPSKDPEATKPEVLQTRQSLERLLNNIKLASDNAYSVTPDSIILRDTSTDYNYDRLFKTRNKDDADPQSYEFGFLKAYRDSGVRLVSNDIATDSDNSLKLPTAGHYDTLNTLNVLNASEKDTDKWRPFKDDQIALFFYDVVNDKYIPFRAAIKGIAESGNASWEEMPFIGRADKVYFYGGFNRNLSFTLKVVISSIKELAPTWQRINYLMTSYKPSNYTKASMVKSGNSRYDRFMVPPMFMLTMGDLYRDQPVLIQSVTLTVPDDAAWETLNKDNTNGDWNYMAGTMRAAGVQFGQVPRDVELGVTLILLEKERAVVGGANFGHAPRTEEFKEWNDEAVPNGGPPNKWHENYVVSVPGLS